MTENEVMWPQVTESDPEVTSFDRKSPGSGSRKPKLTYLVHFTSYKAVARRRRQSHNRKWHHAPQVIVGDLEVTSFDRKSPGSRWRSPKTLVYCTFHFIQCCSLQERAVTWQEMHHVTSGDRNWPGSDNIWPEVTWKWLYKVKNSHILYISLPRRL